jgi:hypothetical protein
VQHSLPPAHTAHLPAVFLVLSSTQSVRAASEHTNLCSHVTWYTAATASGNYFLKLYKTILKLIWTYGIQLWGTASTSNIKILEWFQSKAMRMIVDAPWYVPNTLIRRDLHMPSVKEEISRYSSHYGARLRTHSNQLVVHLIELPDSRRLRRYLPSDLPHRFLL